MMGRTWIALWMGVLAPFAHAASAPSVAVIRLERAPDNSRHRSVNEFKLSKEGKDVVCKGDGILPHKIRVEGLKSFSPPGKAGPLARGCEVRVSWGKWSRCYVKYDNLVLDDIIRQCSTI